MYTEVKTYRYAYGSYYRARQNKGYLLPDESRYRRLVCKVNYLIVIDLILFFAVSVVSQFMVARKTLHWNALMRIMRCLKNNLGGVYNIDYGNIEVEEYSYADWYKNLLLDIVW